MPMPMPIFFLMVAAVVSAFGFRNIRASAIREASASSLVAFGAVLSLVVVVLLYTMRLR